jgi:hypothetical protein
MRFGRTAGWNPPLGSNSDLLGMYLTTFAQPSGFLGRPEIVYTGPPANQIFAGAARQEFKQE